MSKTMTLLADQGAARTAAGTARHVTADCAHG